MYLGHPARLLILGLSTTQAIAVRHGQGPRQYRRLVDNVSSSQADLEQITNAPGPPTIQPGIPALQPSIPTSGVPSLDIPPWHPDPSSKTSDGGSSSQADLELITNAPGPPTIQPGIPALQPSIPTSGVPSLDIPPWHPDPSSRTSDDLEQITNAPGPPTIQPGIPALQPSIPTSGVPSLDIPPWHPDPPSKTSDHLLLSSTYSQIPSLATTSTATSIHATSVVKDPESTPTSIAASIPFLSEWIAQPFTRSPAVSLPTTMIAPVSSSSNVHLSIAGTQSPQEAPAGQVTTLSAGGSDPKDGFPTASMPSTLIYSFMLPPYSGGLISSGIAETPTLTSSAKDKDHSPSASIYSFSLLPYTPKVPTYVATSASVVAISMTTGASGNPSAIARTTEVFLPRGSVDPMKDAPDIATSSTVPLYSPACLGNAYGGGYVITPTVSAANINGTAVAKLPPAYEFTYKLEPTQSPGYGAAVVIANTGAPTQTRAPLPVATPHGGLTSAAGGGIVQISETNTVTTCPCEDTPTFTSTVTEGLITQLLATGQSAVTLSNLNPTFPSITPGSVDTGSYQATSLNPATATSPVRSVISSFSSSIVSYTVSGLRSPSLHSSIASLAAFGSSLAKDAKPSTKSFSVVSGTSPVILPQAGSSNAVSGILSRVEGSATKANSTGPKLAQGFPSTGTSTELPTSAIVADVMGSIASYWHDELQRNSNPSSGASGARINSTVIQDAVYGELLVSKTSSATTRASSGPIAVDSAGATRLPQNQYQRAAMTLSNTSVNTMSAVSSQHFDSQLNDTLMLADNGTDISAFEGEANQLTACRTLALILLVPACLVFNIF